MTNANRGEVVPLAPEPLTLPLAVFSGPYGFLYYIRFVPTCADIWAFLRWFFAGMVVCGVPVLLALRAKDGSLRIAFTVIAFMLWALSGLLAIGLMI